mgnify:CR=1 FL=1
MYIIDEILLTQRNGIEKIVKPSFLSFGILKQMGVAKKILKKAYRVKKVEFKYHKA